jgi:DNA mismatch repair protein MSH5
MWRSFFNRVAEGLSLDSHAAKCAEIFGVPTRIVQRAQHVRCVKPIYGAQKGLADDGVAI